MTPNNSQDDNSNFGDDFTLPTRPAVSTYHRKRKTSEQRSVKRQDIEKAIHSLAKTAPLRARNLPPTEPVIGPAESPKQEVLQVVNDAGSTPADAPWALQQFLNGEMDLENELVNRTPSTPLMSLIYFRKMGDGKHGVVTLSTQDGVATATVEVDKPTQRLELSFTFGSMLTLRFHLLHLSDIDRSRWLELMRREQGGLSFLWGQTRWEHDYVICVSRRYFTVLCAYSPHNIEATIRLTPEVTTKLLNWLEEFWKVEPPEEPASPLITW